MAESVADLIRRAVAFDVVDEMADQLGHGVGSNVNAVAHSEAETMVGEALELTTNEVING